MCSACPHTGGSCSAQSCCGGASGGSRTCPSRATADPTPSWRSDFLLCWLRAAASRPYASTALRRRCRRRPGECWVRSWVARWRSALGYTGATLILLVLLAAGLSLFTGVSWLTVLERLGTWAETAYLNLVQKWQEREDRRAGVQAVIRRDEVVEVSKKKLEVHEPIRIEPPAVEIPKSARVEREKQVPLFENLPDSLLPPLSLLDVAGEEPRGTEHRDSRVHLAPDREEAARLRGRGESRRRLSRAGDHPLRNRARCRRQGQPGHQSDQGSCAGAVGSQHSRDRDHTGQEPDGARDPQSDAPDRAAVGDPEFPGLCRPHIAADAGAGQGHCRQSGGRRSAAHAAPADRRHDRVRQVRGDQRHAVVPGLQVSTVPGTADPDRPEDARAVDLRGHSAPAGAGGHRHAPGRERAQLVRR